MVISVAVPAGRLTPATSLPEGTGAAALLAVATAAALPWLDPVAAVIIAAIALREGAELRRGEADACRAGPAP